MEYKLAFIGFGTVGRGLMEILESQKAYIKKKYDVTFTPVAISDQQKGAVYDPKGIAPKDILAHINKHQDLKTYRCRHKGWDSIKTIEKTNADIVIEASFTNLQTGEPAINHIKKAFAAGKHVVTTNKGPLALAYKKLVTLADKHKVQFEFEGTVLSGTPVFSFVKHCLPGNRIIEIKGILNGTTNYILCEMEKGLDYQKALAQAQSLGFAEAQPDADVKGWDAQAKIAILSEVIMGKKLKITDIPCSGITTVSNNDIAKALKKGYRYKLIADLKNNNGKVSASVGLHKLPLTDPLAGVSGATNAITFVSELLGATTVVGAGAGKTPTGYAIFKDLLEIHAKIKAGIC